MEQSNSLAVLILYCRCSLLGFLNPSVPIPSHINRSESLTGRAVIRSLAPGATRGGSGAVVVFSAQLGASEAAARNRDRRETTNVHRESARADCTCLIRRCCLPESHVLCIFPAKSEGNNICKALPGLCLSNDRKKCTLCHLLKLIY